MVSTMSAEEALSRLTAEERGAVERFRERLKEELGPRLRDLRIYGSKVRGEAHEESDIDLLVLVDGNDHQTTWRIIDIAASINPWLSANVIGFESYHAPASRATGFYKEMRKESVRL